MITVSAINKLRKAQELLIEAATVLNEDLKDICFDAADNIEAGIDKLRAR